ncbi:phosphodiester glycosidase family protein [Pedobacter nyackensis]|nr:phosphodiester glycosidase family protein [Pedobacter nyackensis]
MNLKSNFALILIAAATLMSACSKSKKEVGSGPEEPVVVVDSTPLISLSSSWKKAVHLMADFPNGIQVYMNTTPFNGKALVAYCVVFDPKSGLELKPVTATANKKVSAFYTEETGFRYACINGGFFGTNTSYSLAMYKGAINAINIKSLTRTLNGANATYYPTRAAFGISEEGVPDVSWIYHVGTGNGTIYSYPAPAANLINTAPKPVPTATLPAGGAIWNVKAAIGGSPMLIKDDKINITDKEELIDIDNTSSRARSAIGYTKNNMIVLLAVEGNITNGGAGLNLAELAQLMKEMGCVGAVNLDGGGSTSMTVRAKPTVKPSDGAERPVMTALIIKRK